jgi:pimeloyl-ACP methyl ester carboxylesterase
MPPVLVIMRGDEAGLSAVREALSIAGPDDTPSLIVREATEADVAASGVSPEREVGREAVAPLTLTARDDRYLIRRTDDAYPLMVPVEQGYTDFAAKRAVERLEHVARWLQLAQLENKTSALPPDAVSLEVYAVKEDGSSGERIDPTGTVRLPYRWQDDEWVRPRFMLKLANNTDRRLYCMLVDLTEKFGVSTSGLLKGGGVWLEPKGRRGSEIWAYTYHKGKPIPAAVPDDLHKQGVVAVRDLIKLIVSTTESNATLLERSELEVAMRGTKGVVEKPIPKSSLSRLMRRVQTRAIGEEAEDEEALVDWITSQVTITTVRPREGVPVPESGEVATLSDIVTLEGHATLRANARLTSIAEGSRDAGNLALPAVLREFPELARPFEFSDHRGGEPGMSVLELEVEEDTYRSVTPEAPLTLQVAKPIADDEYVLPLAFDPETELFLPLGSCRGKKDGVTITIDRLPQPGGTRGKLGSVKLFFQKFIADKLGLDAATARLAVATVREDGQVDYEDSPVAVSQKVKAAQRILLYVHGFMGDTKRLVASSQGLPHEVDDPPPTLGERYDLILAFDYENINTPIDMTALKLKELLKSVGLGAGHDKTLHIIAHSMGTMVTRWLIEREGGHRFVQKVVLAAPPNAGTPWAKIQDLVLFGLGLAINGLAAIAWPPSIIPTLIGTLSTIVGGVEQVDVTCDQLKPGSDFYKKLAGGDEPGAYAIIAGNTSKIVAGGSPIRPSEVPLLKKLADKLVSNQTRYKLMSLAFFGKPNDYAVSLESMLALPPERVIEPLQEIACDHASYFVTKVGLEALAKALG